jgi:hypothetical protein
MARKKIDLDMLANDVADMMDRFGYLDDLPKVSEEDIRPLLDGFVAQLREANARKLVVIEEAG